MSDNNPPPYDVDAARVELAREDPPLGTIIERVGAYRLVLRDTSDPFRGLLRAIVYQQLSGRAAGTIHERLKALFPDHHPAPEALLALPETALRGAGLSAAKTAAARDLAAKTLDGTVPPGDAMDDLDNDTLIERLTRIRGIGQWTVEMLLIFNLGRADVLPVNDLGIRKGFAVTYGLDALPKPAALKAHGARWAPWRSVASWYLWRASELPD
ncbi:DNA-3-methyladenine glycosylase family protein [Aquisalimonas asiatica]|uniref:DNA-3-methyladenine glycosylase II n=1 Tax=Aquisalimonas asiatica TaxID=406100 RepID=A0A1H8TKD2_9GAMM|nr:DNA-3-methyladenine glycosylase [Aquisalimonas asiatica]SEO90948.1 DNA-3-methyladenine glycosylase II [Aquisalimonas asiatica]